MRYKQNKHTYAHTSYNIHPRHPSPSQPIQPSNDVENHLELDLGHDWHTGKPPPGVKSMTMAKDKAEISFGIDERD